MATANAKLRDATEQLRDVLLHRLRSEARIADREKRLVVVKANRQKHAEGRMQGVTSSVSGRLEKTEVEVKLVVGTAPNKAGDTATRQTSKPRPTPANGPTPTIAEAHAHISTNPNNT